LIKLYIKGNTNDKPRIIYAISAKYGVTAPVRKIKKEGNKSLLEHI